MTNKYINFPAFYFFVLYSIAFVFFTFSFNYILLDDALFYKSFGETLGVDRIAHIISQQRFFQKIGYGIIPFVLLLRAFYTAVCLFIGIFVLEKKIKFNECFNIAIKADIIFLIELVIKINYFSFLGVNSLQELNTHLFSALQWAGVNNMEQWLSYPMSILNVFEVIYWLLLALFLSHYTEESFGTSLGFVAKTYGIGLLLWIVFIMFLVLNFS